MVKRALIRLTRRPVPWVLHVLVITLPALVLAPLLTAVLLPRIDVPLFTRVLEERSLALLVQLVASPEAAPLDDAAWMVWLAIGGAAAAWIAVKLAWTWLAGATLSAYAAERPLGLRAFIRAGFRWFLPFLALSLIGALVSGVIGAAGLAAAVGVYFRLRPALGWALLALTGIVVGAWGMLIEVARACAVASDETGPFDVLRRAAKLARHRTLPLLGIVLGALAAYGGLALLNRQLTAWIPIRWWLVTLVVQQLVVILRQGIRLARQAGELELALQSAEMA